MVRTTPSALVLVLGVLLASAASEGADKARAAGAQEKAVRHPDLSIPTLQEPAHGRQAARGSAAFDADLAALGATPDSVLFDVRAGRWSSLVVHAPLIPGRGNRLRWSDVGVAEPAGREDQGEHAWRAFEKLLSRLHRQLRVEPAELGRPRLSVTSNGELIRMYSARVVGGVRVRDSELTAVVNNGNLVLLALKNWGDVEATPRAAVDAASARGAVRAHLQPLAADFTAEPRLELIPLARGREAEAVTPGRGYDYRLAWVLTARVAGDVGTWEALVDAATGALLALEDKNLYQSSRSVVGGVYPSSNDGVGPEGTEQPGFPMPYADVHAGATTVYANSGGVAGCVSGDITTTLNGKYVRIVDNCGALNETSAGSLDLGTSAGTNCTVPAGHSAGDTHAARTTYYELNRMFEQGRAYLPDNEWLQGQVTAYVNITSACNAYWDGSALNFTRDNGGCANTAELASIIDHEWAHGLDNNGANPTISRPSEAFGYALTAFRQVDSCIARGLVDFNCAGYGDACLACNGIDDVDFAAHASSAPHTLAFAMACPPSSGASGPCGRSAFCEATIVGEAAWDLFARDLQGSPFNYDANTALEVATRLFYLAGDAVGDWYQCTAGFAGCAATGGYLNMLVADDDDGDLANGTPHMTAIFNAFNRHGIACATPSVASSGCERGPTTATGGIEATALDQAVRLDWKEVPGATRYAIYRTEGVNGCDFGKARVGETTNTSFTDEGLLNDFAYHYMVLPLGAADTCVGRMSECRTVTPVPGPNLTWDGTSSLQLTTGDGDAVVDNCEVATARFTIVNNGGLPLTNVRILTVGLATHPATQLLDAPPVPVTSSLDTCGTASGRFSFVPQGLAFDETMDLVVTFTAEELAPQTRTALLRYTHVESDFQAQASRTFGFETGLDGWQILEGTWTRQSSGGGAGGTAFYVRSSSALDNQCDRIQSPLVTLSGASTLTMSTRYQIEPSDGFDHYDRANVGLVNDVGGRTTVSPDTGHLYTIPTGEPYIGCGLQNEPGWNGTNPANPGFNASTWSPAALNVGGSATGLPVRLDIAYATELALALDGFRFDQVTLTNFGEQVADVQSNTCGAVPTANVGIVKTDGQTTATPGAPISYTLTVTNAGPATLTSVEVQDALPAALVSPVFTPSVGSYDPATGVWTGLRLAASQSATLTLAATVSPAATGTLTNTATVSPGPLSDPTPSNNSSSDVDTLGPPDLIFEDGFDPS